MGRSPEAHTEGRIGGVRPSRVAAQERGDRHEAIAQYQFFEGEAAAGCVKLHAPITGTGNFPTAAAEVALKTLSGRPFATSTFFPPRMRL